jgi:hypothetical protein
MHLTKDTMNVVNPDQHFRKVSLVEPTGHFYLQIAAEVDQSILPVFFTTSDKKKRLLKLCKQFCEAIEPTKEIVSAVVFKARIIPPGRGKFVDHLENKVHIARFDVAILIESTTLEGLEGIRNSGEFRRLYAEIEKASTFTHMILATNAKQINPVDHHTQGVFLFNYFYADSVKQNLDIWEYTAGWFQQETGLDNSTVLLPMDPQKSAYAIINHCRWNGLADILPSLIFKRSFKTYVLDNFFANHVAAMPVLYRLA